VCRLHIRQHINGLSNRSLSSHLSLSIMTYGKGVL
jgi:hypothetical protein